MAENRPCSMASLCQENFLVTTSNIIFRKKQWNKLGKFAPLRYCHDIEFFLKIMRTSNYIIESGFAGTIYRIHENNTIAESFEAAQEELRAVIADHLWHLLRTNVTITEYKETLHSLKLRNHTGKVLNNLARRLFFQSSIDFFLSLSTGKEVYPKSNSTE
jgi:hypothetical protein